MFDNLTRYYYYCHPSSDQGSTETIYVLLTRLKGVMN